MKTTPEAMKILLALAKEARISLQEANRALTELENFRRLNKELQTNFSEDRVSEDYLKTQKIYVQDLNVLSLAKSAVGRK